MILGLDLDKVLETHKFLLIERTAQRPVGIAEADRISHYKQIWIFILNHRLKFPDSLCSFNIAPLHILVPDITSWNDSIREFPSRIL